MSVLADHEPRDRFLYLRSLLATSASSADHELGVGTRISPSSNVAMPLRILYLRFLCEYEPSDVIGELSRLPANFIDRNEVARICEEVNLYEAVVWCITENGDVRGALQKVEQFSEKLADELVESLQKQDASYTTDDFLSSLRQLQRRAVSVCLEQSKSSATNHGDSEESWFTLLRSQITCVHRILLGCTPSSDTKTDTQTSTSEQAILEDLRTSIHETFNSLLSVSSTKAVSFPRLFKRLVDVRDSRVSKGTQYTEFRAILGGMLESYRSEGDMLVLTKQLMYRDLFVSVDALAKARSRGWAPSRGVCSTCGERLHGNGKSKAFGSDEEDGESGSSAIIVSRTGAIYHRNCLPTQDTTNSSQ